MDLAGDTAYRFFGLRLAFVDRLRAVLDHRGNEKSDKEHIHATVRKTFMLQSPSWN
jgi:hypothetical protein